MKWLIFLLPVLIEAKNLVIILAETRASELTYSNIEENLIKRLDADLAVCVGVKEDYDFSNPFYQNAKYRFTYPEPEDYASAFDDAYREIISTDKKSHNTLYWREFLKIKDQFLGGIKDPIHEHPGSAGILIFFRWFLLKNLIEQQLLEKYDFFIITRSDYIYTLPHPKNFHNDQILIPNSQQYGGVTDRHVVLPRRFVIPYLNILSSMVLNGKQYYQKMEQFQYWNLERLIWFHLIQNKVDHHVKFFPYVMYTVRPIGGSTRWSSGIFSETHNYYIKYPEEYKISHQYLSDFLHSSMDLDSFYEMNTH